MGWSAWHLGTPSREDPMSTDVIYKTTDPRAVATQIELLVRTDVGALSPLEYSVSGVAQKQSAAKAFLDQVGLQLIGGRMPGLITLEFELPARRSAWLTVSAGHNRDASYCGSLAFLVAIDRQLTGEVEFEKRKAVVKAPRFKGGPEAEKLNAVPGLTKRIDKILVAKNLVGMGTLEIKPSFRLVPAEKCTWLAIRTLPTFHTHLMSVSGSTNAGEVLKIADEIEVALGR
jgi:hypothetical protein